MSQRALELLKAKFPDDVLATGSHRGDEWAKVRPAAVRDVLAWLKSEPALDMKLLADITCVDYLLWDPDRPLAQDDPERLAVVYHLASVTTHQRLEIKAYVPAGATVPTVVGVFRTADWWERLAYDFYGIKFGEHPNLKRILLYEEFEGHPMLKDYPLHKRQPLTPERDMPDLVRGPGPGGSDKHAPFSQRPGARKHVRSDSYD